MAKICLFDEWFLKKINIYHCLNYFYLTHTKIKTKTKKLSGLIKILSLQLSRQIHRSKENRHLRINHK